MLVQAVTSWKFDVTSSLETGNKPFNEVGTNRIYLADKDGYLCLSIWTVPYPINKNLKEQTLSVIPLSDQTTITETAQDGERLSVSQIQLTRFAQ